MNAKLYGIPVTIVLVGLILFTTCGLKPKEGGKSDLSEDGMKMVTAPPVPDSVLFMGENVPLDRFDIFESLDREILVNTYFHSQTIRFIKLAPRYFRIIDPILKEEEIPGDFRYLMVAESNLSPRAISPKGAAG